MDKRNQTLECPHCDRTFQQVQRYREHIAKKHADEVEESNAAAASSSQATEPTMQVDLLIRLYFNCRVCDYQSASANLVHVANTFVPRPRGSQQVHVCFVPFVPE